MPKKFGNIELHDYQADALDCIFHAFNNGTTRALVQLPTGTGKTILMGAVAHTAIYKYRWPVMLLAHRSELLGQAAEKLNWMGLETVLEKANSRAQNDIGMYGSDGSLETVVLGSIQTLKGNRLREWPVERFGLIFVDEAHHIVSKQYQDLLNHFKHYCLLGVTATACRADKKNLGQVFNQTSKPVYEFRLKDAIELGYLVPIEIRRIFTGIDMKNIRRTTEGDLNMEDVAEAISSDINRLCQHHIIPECGEGKTILFAPNIRTSEAFASCISALGRTARAVSSHDTDEYRANAVKDFVEGRLQYLCNCGIFTEGFDVNSIDNVVTARPTTSRTLYSQMVGRGTRLNPPHKKKMVLVDLVLSSEQHELVHPVELFDNSDFDAEVQEMAKKMIDQGEFRDISEAINSAERKHKENKRLKVAAQEVDRKQSKKITYDPMGLCGAGLLTYRKSDFEGSWRATPEQIEQLSRFNIANPGLLTRSGAQRRLNVLWDRRRKGLASHLQLAHLISNGVNESEAIKMGGQEASRQLSLIFGKN